MAAFLSIPRDPCPAITSTRPSWSITAPFPTRAASTVGAIAERPEQPPMLAIRVSSGSATTSAREVPVSLPDGSIAASAVVTGARSCRTSADPASVTVATTVVGLSGPAMAAAPSPSTAALTAASGTANGAGPSCAMRPTASPAPTPATAAERATTARGALQMTYTAKGAVRSRAVVGSTGRYRSAPSAIPSTTAISKAPLAGLITSLLLGASRHGSRARGDRLPEHFGEVPHDHGLAAPVDAAAEVGEAAGVVGDDTVNAGRLDVRELSLEDAIGDLGIL